MNILITGSEGFVGRHFQKYLKNKYPEAFILGIDIKSGRDCRDFFKSDERKWDIIVHCAAIVGGREKIDGEPISVATDLSIDSEMFNWAVRTGQERIIYFSSSAAYPISLQTGTPYLLKESDIDLNDIKNPDMSYGWTKLTGEFLAQFARKSGVKVHVVRPFSGYGPDQDETYPFPSFIKRIKDKIDPFEIWGDGNQVRDFIHIDDIVEAVMKMVELEHYGPLNLGTGIARSFNEVAELMFSISGFRPKEIKHLTEKPVGVMYRVANTEEMFKIYKPKISFEDGIRESLNS